MFLYLSIGLVLAGVLIWIIQSETFDGFWLGFFLVFWGVVVGFIHSETSNPTCCHQESHHVVSVAKVPDGCMSPSLYGIDCVFFGDFLLRCFCF